MSTDKVTASGECVAAANVLKLRRVAHGLGNLTRKAVFLGGTILPFLVEERVSGLLRSAKDVDFMIASTSKPALWAYEDAMWERGFRRRSGGALGTWLFEGLTVDVIPADADIMGFANPWRPESLGYAEELDIGSGSRIRAVSASYFLGIKLHSYLARRRPQDLYDVLLVLGGRPGIDQEVAERATPSLRSFLACHLADLRQNGAIAKTLAAPTPGRQDGTKLTREIAANVERVTTRIAVMAG